MSQNFSNLFSGISGSSNWYSDWASIKNGSYRTLMKSYYSGIEGGNTRSFGSTAKTNGTLEKILEERRNPKVSEEVQKANTKLTAGVSSLKNAVSALQNKDTYTDSEDGKGKSATDKVASSVKDFVTIYNDVVTAAKKSTLSSKTSHIAAVMKATEANADKLKEIGITINRNGTLQLNADKLKATDVSKVEQLFSKEDILGYGSVVMSRLNFAGISSGTVESKEKENTTDVGALSLKEAGEMLASDKLYGKVKGEDGSYQYDIEKIFSAAKSFADSYNKMFESAKSSLNSGVIANLASIREKTAQNKDTLAQFGISVDAKGNMKVDEDAFKKADMSEVQKFFKGYGASIASNASLVEYYMKTQADASNPYTPEGAYNVQGSNYFSDFI